MEISFTPFHCFKASVPEQAVRAEHVHDIHEFVICLDGNGTQFAGRVGMAQRRGDVFCFPSGMSHYCSGKPGKPAELYVIMVPDSMFTPDAYGDRETYLAVFYAAFKSVTGKTPRGLRTEFLSK